MRFNPSYLALGLAAAIGLMSCVDGDSPTGVLSTGVARLAIVPSIAPGIISAAAEAQAINRIRVTARKATDGTVLVVHQQDVDPNAAEWTLEVDIPVPEDGSRVVLTIELIHLEGGTETVEWSGQSAPLTLTAGQSTQAREVEVVRGPASNLGVTSVTVTPPSATIEEGDTLRLTAAVTTTSTETPVVYWGSLDPQAQVDGNGLVTGLLPGTARVVAESGERADTSLITVEAVPGGVVVTPDSVVVDVAGTVVTFQGSVVDARGDPVAGEPLRWASRDTPRVESLGDGDFRAFGAGRAWIEARASSDTTLVDSALVVVLAPQADLVIAKSANRTEIAPGDTLTYTVTVSNDGPDAAGPFRVVDHAPASLIPVSTAVTAGTSVLDSLLWRVDGLAVGAAATWTLRFVAGTGIASEPLLFNSAVIDDAETFDPDLDNNEAIHELGVVQGVELAVQKFTSDDNPFAGSTVTFTVVVDNYGPRLATGVQVVDQADAGISTVVSSSATRGAYSTQTGVWSLDSIPTDHSDTLRLVVQVGAGTSGQTLTNRAYLSGPTAALDLDRSNDSASVTVAPAERQADLSVLKTVDKDDPLEGDTVTFEVVVDNFGPELVRSVVLKEAPDVGIRHVVAATFTEGTVDTVAGTWTLDSIPAGTADTLKLRVVVDSGTVSDTLWNRIGVQSYAAAADPDLTNNADSTWVLPVQREADLNLLKTVDENQPFDGDTIVFEIVVDNWGPDTAHAVIVGDSADVPGFTVHGVYVSQGTLDTLTGLWTVGDIAPGASDTVRIEAVPDTGLVGDTIKNRVKVASLAEVDPDTTNNASVASLVVQPRLADLNVTKTVDDPMPFEGDTVLYEIVVDNFGPDLATGVEIEDFADVGVRDVVDYDLTGGVADSVTLTWSLDSIPNGGSDTLWLWVVVDSGTVSDTLANAVVGIGDQVDPDSLNNADSAWVVVQERDADLALHKFLDDDAPFEGDTVRYMVELENWGGFTAHGLEVFDSLDVGLTLVADSATAGTFDTLTGVWSVDSLPPGDGDTLFLKAVVDSGTVSQVLTNRAGVAALSGVVDTDPLNDTAAVALTVGLMTADIDVHKIVDQSSAFEGDQVKFTVTVDNFGDYPATNVPVIDTVTAGLTVDSVVVMTGAWNAGSRTWTIPSLGVGSPEVMLVFATIDSGTVADTLWNHVVIGGLSTEVDTISSNNTDSASVVVGERSADLALHKFVDTSNPFEGDTVTYLVELQNFGSDVARNVEVFDSLDAGLTQLSDTATRGAFDVPSRTWTVDSIAPGETDTLTLKVAVDSFTVGDTLWNRAGAFAMTHAVESDVSNDTASVSVVVTEAPTQSLTWVGGDVSDPQGFNVAANWSPPVSPRAIDDVHIVSAASSPRLSAADTVHDLAVDDGVTLDLNGFDLVVEGSLSAGNTIVGASKVIMTGTSVGASGTVSNLSIQGDVSLTGSTHVTGVADVSAGGKLSVGAHTLVVDGAFTVKVGSTADAGLFMDDPAGDVTTKGPLTFQADGTNSGEGMLTDGTLRVQAGLAQTQPSGGLTTAAFASTGTSVVFEGTVAQTVTFDTPGATDSRFHSVSVDAGATVSLGTGADADNVTLNGALTVPTAKTLAVTNVFTLGSTGLLGVDGAVTAASCTDLGGIVTGSGTQPCGSALTFGKVWLGTTADWNTASNWLPSGVPGTSDDVLVQAATATQPVMSANGSTRNVLIESGASLTQGGFTLSVYGDLQADGGISGGLTHVLGSGSVLKGDVDDLTIGYNRSVTGQLSLTGDLTLDNRQLTAGAQTIQVGGDLSVSGSSGRLVMTNGAGVVDVEGSATFDGAGHDGYLTNGVLYVAGDFTVGDTQLTGEAFRGTSNHTVVFDGTAAQTVTLTNPGTGGNDQLFENVTFANTTATVTMAGHLVVADSLRVVSGATVDASDDSVYVATRYIDPANGLSAPTWFLWGEVDELPASLAGDLYVQSTVYMDTDLDLTGNLFATQYFEVNNQTISVSGNVEVTGVNGRVAMIDAADTLDVEGNVTYDGAHHDGYLTNGVMFVAGDFTAGNAEGHGEAFRGTSNHTVVFDGTAAQTVTLSNPGTGGNDQLFENVTFANTTATVTMAGHLVVADSLQVVSGATVDASDDSVYVATRYIDPANGLSAPTWFLWGEVDELPASLTGDLYVQSTVYMDTDLDLTGNLFATQYFEVNNQTISVSGNVQVTGVNGRVAMIDAADTLDVEGNVTYDGAHHDGYLTNGVLYVAGDFTAGNAEGHGEAFRGTSNHTVVFDGTAAQTVTLTNPGTGGNDQLFENVTFANTTATVTMAGHLVVADSLQVVSGATVDASDDSVYVATRYIDPANGLSAPTWFLWGEVDELPAALTGDLYVQSTVYMDTDLDLTGNLFATQYFEVNNQTISVSGNVEVTGVNGRVAMIDAADTLDVEGNVTYDGAHHDGYLTNGVMFVAGDFTVGDTQLTGEAFRGTSNHTVVFDGTAAQTVTLTNPGTGGNDQLFENVTFANTTATVTMAGHLVVADSLRVVSGATVDASDDSVYVATRYIDPANGLSAPTWFLWGEVDELPASLTGDLYVQSTVYMDTDLDLTGNLFATQYFEVNNQTISVSGNVEVTGVNGRVAMIDAADILDVEGNVTYDGAHHDGYLTNGVMYVAGDFTAGNAEGHGEAFRSTSNHTVVLDGSSTQTIDFSNPGTGGNDQLFHNVTFNTSAVALNSDIYATGLMYVDGDHHTDFSGGHSVNIQGTFDITGSTFDSTSVSIDANITPAGNTFSQPTFQNMDTTVTQLSVLLRGGTLEIGSATFSTPPSTGVYVHAESKDANLLTVNLTGSSPLDGNGATESEGANAVIYWDADLAANDQ